jgi:hypothetical protein
MARVNSMIARWPLVMEYKLHIRVSQSVGGKRLPARGRVAARWMVQVSAFVAAGFADQALSKKVG